MAAIPSAAKPYVLPDSGYSVSFIIPNGVIAIKGNGDTEISLRPGSVLTNAEMAATAVFAQTVAKLRNGKLLDFDVALENFEDGQELVKCEWLKRSNNLKLHGPTDHVYRFVNTVDKAMLQKRVFTCFRTLYKVLPKTRKLEV